MDGWMDLQDLPEFSHSVFPSPAVPVLSTRAPLSDDNITYQQKKKCFVSGKIDRHVTQFKGPPSGLQHHPMVRKCNCNILEGFFVHFVFEGIAPMCNFTFFSSSLSLSLSPQLKPSSSLCCIIRCRRLQKLFINCHAFRMRRRGGENKEDKLRKERRKRRRTDRGKKKRGNKWSSD